MARSKKNGLSGFEVNVLSSFSLQRNLEGDYVVENKLKVSHDGIDVNVYVTASSRDEEKLNVDDLDDLMYLLFEAIAYDSDVFPNLPTYRE